VTQTLSLRLAESDQTEGAESNFRSFRWQSCDQRRCRWVFNLQTAGIL